MKNIELMTEIDAVMSNCFHEIEKDVEEELKSQPGEVWAAYPGWNFYGHVWFENDEFTCQVWVHKSPREEITADTLEELMDVVSSEYGYD